MPSAGASGGDPLENGKYTPLLISPTPTRIQMSLGTFRLFTPKPLPESPHPSASWSAQLFGSRGSCRSPTWWLSGSGLRPAEAAPSRTSCSSGCSSPAKEEKSQTWWADALRCFLLRASSGLTSSLPPNRPPRRTVAFAWPETESSSSDESWLSLIPCRHTLDVLPPEIPIQLGTKFLRKLTQGNLTQMIISNTFGGQAKVPCFQRSRHAARNLDHCLPGKKIHKSLGKN